MIRRQIQLTEGQDAAVRRAAARRRVSVAAFVRDAIQRALQSETESAKRERALAAVGKFTSDGADVAREHDRYLRDAYRR